MARRTSRTPREQKSTRTPRAKPRKSAAPEAEVAEDSSASLDTAFIIMTTVALIAALGFTDALLGKFGAGVIF